jgi:2,3,4,5-tetrahydropyridine-2-carboxylate N-succinyltransferase
LNLYKLHSNEEDGAFIGSRCIVVEGVHVGKLSLVLTCLTASTKIIDVTGETPVEMKGFVPAVPSSN